MQQHSWQNQTYCAFLLKAPKIGTHNYRLLAKEYFWIWRRSQERKREVQYKSDGEKWQKVTPVQIPEFSFYTVPWGCTSFSEYYSCYSRCSCVTVFIFVLICTNSSASTFSSKEITGIATSWCRNGSPEDLAEVLGQPIPEEEATDTDKCSTILQKWLEQKNEGTGEHNSFASWKKKSTTAWLLRLLDCLKTIASWVLHFFLRRIFFTSHILLYKAWLYTPLEMTPSPASI